MIGVVVDKDIAYSFRDHTCWKQSVFSGDRRPSTLSVLQTSFQDACQPRLCFDLSTVIGNALIQQQNARADNYPGIAI
jgi:hypothetical protein